MTMRSGAILVLILGLAGCGGGGDGGNGSGGGVVQGTCTTDKTELSFRLIYPTNPFTGSPDCVGVYGQTLDDVTLVNVGSSNISGTVTLTRGTKPGTNNTVSFRLRSGTNPDYVIAPSGSRTFEVVASSCPGRNDMGTYRGSADLGSSCGTIGVVAELRQ